MTYKLTVVYEGRTLDRYEFADDEEITVGRHEDCEIRIDNNKGISRRHCEILCKDGAHVLKDLGSSNGTYVNGKKIKRHTLNTGDVFSVVGMKIKYEGSAKAVTREAPEKPLGLPDLTMNVNPKSFRKAAAATGGGRGGASKIHGHIVIAGETKNTVLLHKSAYSIGKDPKADLAIEGAFTPRLAALIVRDQREFWLLDVSPKGNAVTVNDEEVRSRTLVDGDVVKIGGGKVEFEYHQGLPQVESSPANHSDSPNTHWSRRDAGFLD